MRREDVAVVLPVNEERTIPAVTGWDERNTTPGTTKRPHLGERWGQIG